MKRVRLFSLFTATLATWVVAIIAGLCLYRSGNFVCQTTGLTCQDSFNFFQNYYSDLGRIEPYVDTGSRYHAASRMLFVLSGVLFTFLIAIAVYTLIVYGDKPGDSRSNIALAIAAFMFIIATITTVATPADVDEGLHGMGAVVSIVSLTLLAWTTSILHESIVFRLLFSLELLASIACLTVSVMAVMYGHIYLASMSTVGAVAQRAMTVFLITQVSYIIYNTYALMI